MTRIAFVCDFFYPRLGGVEMHQWSLAQKLIQLGHKVIIITHAYNHRKGVRYLPGPLKVYYCPIHPMVDEDALPTFSATLPLMRHIFLREQIEIVHAHQATSTMANEAVVFAGALGLPCVYTDHSLFGFNDVASVILNRVQQTTLATVDAAICVSRTCRDNLRLRAKVERAYVIPNAIDPTKFTPDVTQRSQDGTITVVVISRLVYRKGMDLLVHLIPLVCHDLPHVNFIIGGDGPKRLDLQEMVERERLQDRVEFLGFVPHQKTCHVLRRGHVFLNCSLTESFCIAILEAACTGLLVVSTNVGGIPEVLPGNLCLLADPQHLVSTLKQAIARQEDPSTALNAWDTHKQVAQMYSWSRVAKDTCQLYQQVLARRRLSLYERLHCYYKAVGMVAGTVVCLLVLIIEGWLRVIEWWQPQENIDVVPDLTATRDNYTISCYGMIGAKHDVPEIQGNDSEDVNDDDDKDEVISTTDSVPSLFDEPSSEGQGGGGATEVSPETEIIPDVTGNGESQLGQQEVSQSEQVAEKKLEPSDENGDVENDTNTVIPLSETETSEDVTCNGERQALGRDASESEQQTEVEEEKKAEPLYENDGVGNETNNVISLGGLSIQTNNSSSRNVHTIKASAPAILKL